MSIEHRRRPKAMVFAPTPLLTITIEAAGDGPDEIHLHAGGQGFWVARMLDVLDVRAVLCSTFGGETGAVIKTVVAAEGVEPRGIDAARSNGAYVHDRRSGERFEVARMPAMPLTRHDVDDLYGVTLTEGLDADVCILGGPTDASVLPAEVYGRLAGDLTRNGRTVVVDLSGEQLMSAVNGGVMLAKVSAEDMVRDGQLARGGDPVAGLEALRAEGAENVVMTRADAPALALVGDRLHEVRAPTLHAIDSHGAGDSFTAATAAALARGTSVEDAVRLGAAAGSLNVTRRGLASGNRDEIDRMAAHVTVRHR